jgi:hypothetical protein
VKNSRNHKKNGESPRVRFTVKAGDFSAAVDVHWKLVELFTGRTLPLTTHKAFQKFLNAETALKRLLREIEERTGCKAMQREGQRSVVFFGTPDVLGAVDDELQRYTLLTCKQQCWLGLGLWI